MAIDRLLWALCAWLDMAAWCKKRQPWHEGQRGGPGRREGQLDTDSILLVGEVRLA